MPSRPRRSKKGLVQRITVDEVLGESLVRLLVADLRDGVEALTEDRVGDWTPEREVFVTRDDFLAILGLPKKGAAVARAAREFVGEAETTLRSADAIWRSLAEGQVFLSGQFEVERDRHKPKRMRIRRGAKDFLRVDRADFVKAPVKALYAEALVGREGGHARTDSTD